MLPNILSHRPPLQNEVKFFDLEKDRIDLISYRVLQHFSIGYIFEVRLLSKEHRQKSGNITSNDD